jgi:hypothetical protein
LDQQPQHLLGIPRAHRIKQTYDETLLPVHHASRVSDVFFNTAEVIFEAHVELTPRTSKCANGAVVSAVPGPRCMLLATGFAHKS